MIIELNRNSKEFELIKEGAKTFERVCDYPNRYKISDYIAFNELKDNVNTGRCCLVQITYIEPADNDFIIIGFRPCFINPKDNDLNVPKQRFLYSAPVYDREVSTDAK
jgi:hypothetical protein